jgi:hypothetical protein
MKTLACSLVVLAIAAACLTPEPVAAAGKYDGSAPMICAAMAVTECIAGGRCQRRGADQVNFPSIFRVDVKSMKLRGLEAEKGRETSIRNVDRATGRVILSGAEGERGWTVLINEASGKMSATAAGDGEGFVIFGQCGLQ